MRVTFNSGFAQAAADVTLASRQLAERQREVSSGKRMHTASDDPSAAAGSVRERSEMATLDRYAATAESATSRLSVVDIVMSDIVEQLTAAQTAILGARNSVATPAQQEAAASQLEGVRDALASDFNTKHQGAYLFSGTAALVAPYTRQPDGSYSAYQGDAGTVAVDIDRETVVDLSMNADTIARGSATDDLFVHLQRAIAAARAGNQPDLAAAADAISQAFDRATAAQSRTGTAMNAITTQQGRLSELKQASDARVNEFEAANMVEAISRMNQADTAYRAALGSIGKRNGASLMDYLK